MIVKNTHNGAVGRVIKEYHGLTISFMVFMINTRSGVRWWHKDNCRKIGIKWYYDRAA